MREKKEEEEAVSEGLRRAKDGNGDQIVVRKYANRRLYNVATSSYVTLSDLADLIRAGRDLVVRDARTDEDITRSVFVQILLEQDSKDGQLLPTRFLQQLICMYGDGLRDFVPGYLVMCLEYLMQEQRRFSQRMADWSGMSMEMMWDRMEKNVALFDHAVAAGGTAAEREPIQTQGCDSGDQEKRDEVQESLEDLKEQIAALRSRMDILMQKESEV